MSFPKPGVVSSQHKQRKLKHLPQPNQRCVTSENARQFGRIVHTEARMYPDGSVLLVRADNDGKIVGSFRLFPRDFETLRDVLAS